MGARDLRRKLAARRILESAIATVLGGLILWSVTSSMSRPTPATEGREATAAPIIQSTPAPGGPSLAASETNEYPVPPVSANVSLLASIPGPAVALPSPKPSLSPYSVPVGSILLYENFSHYREGDVTDWGPNTFVKMGLDHRNWLVSNVDGTHPVGRTIRLPKEFCFECRYSAYMPEITRGILGWWKDPVSTRISFLNDQGLKSTIEWVVKCGNDPTRLTLESPSLCAKKYYHVLRLPDGTANEVGVIQPTGTLRVDRNNDAIKVSVDGQAAVVGTMSPMGQLVGFEIDVVKAKNGTLFFTDFKVGR